MSFLSNPWLEIQDVIGPANKWPVHIRRKFWLEPVNYVNRLKIAAFCYCNGVSPMLCIEVYSFCNSDFKAVDSFKIEGLYKYWVSSIEHCQKYYAYNLHYKSVVPLPHIDKHFLFPNWPRLW